MSFVALAVGGAIAVVGGAMKAKAGNAAAGAQYGAGLMQEKLSWEQNTADNKAISLANLTNTIRTGYKVGLANLQQANAKKQMLEQGYDLGKVGQQLLGSNAANAAANGSIGHSVDAVVSDINSKIGDAEVVQVQNYNIQNQNFDTLMHDLLNQGVDALRQAQNANVQHPNAPAYTGIGEVVAGAAMQMGMQYMGQNMSLGLGSAGQAPMRTFNVQPGTAAMPSSVSSLGFLDNIKAG